MVGKQGEKRVQEEDGTCSVGREGRDEVNLREECGTKVEVFYVD